jgi:hypothetical protein
MRAAVTKRGVAGGHDGLIGVGCVRGFADNAISKADTLACPGQGLPSIEPFTTQRHISEARGLRRKSFFVLLTVKSGFGL